MTRYERHLLKIISELLAAETAKNEAEHRYNTFAGGMSLDDRLERHELHKAVGAAGDRYTKAKMAAAQEIIENAGAMEA
jgi:hypothetical protein